MTFVHGKNTFISLNAVNLSTFCNTSSLTRTADSSDTTTYGATAHDYTGGLTDGTASIGGIYDNTAGTSPRATIEPLIGSKVTLIRRPEGTGSGKPQNSVTVLITNYVETNPVADMVTWTCELQLSGAVNNAAQP